MIAHWKGRSSNQNCGKVLSTATLCLMHNPETIIFLSDFLVLLNFTFNSIQPRIPIFHQQSPYFSKI